MAATRLKNSTPLAAPALILGANAPDIDAITMLMDRDLALWFRRGWTHGILAMVVLPIALTALLLLVDRVVGRVRGRPPTAKAACLLGLSALAVATHPLLDWLNTYGVRFLMPFDGTWFYGDALFIVDPWIWLLLGASSVLAFSNSKGSIAGWIALGAVTTWLVGGFAGAPPATRWLWCGGVVTIAFLRSGGLWRQRVSRLANTCLAAALAYVALMVALSDLAVRQAAGWLAQRGVVAEEIMASPAPGNPFRREIVVASDGHYRFLEVDWLGEEVVRFAHPPIEHGPDDAVTRAALAAPHVKGFAGWTRYPAFHLEENEDGYRVFMSDVRYTRRSGSRLGSTVVELNRDLSLKPR